MASDRRAMAAPDGVAAARSGGVSRRAFLKAGLAAGGGLMVAVVVPPSLRGARAQGAPPATAARASFAPSAWIRIGEDDTVTVVVDKSEMGQGVMTALPMLVAEELEVDVARLKVETAPADPAYNHPWFGIQATGGSTSVRAMWEPLSRAGATAREMLIAAAAAQWQVEATTCGARAGEVVHAASGRRATYGSLAARAAAMPAPKEVKLKSPDQWTVLGRPRKRLDSAAKVDGKAVFGIDVRLPGMLYAVIARPPTIGGGVKSFDAEKVKAVPGVRFVVALESGVAVVATSTWTALKGRETLAVEWDRGPLASLSSAALSAKHRELAASPGKVAKSAGDVETALAGAATKVEAEYEMPYLAHSCMEPLNCTARVAADGVELWVGTQAPTLNQQVAAKVAGVRPDQVKVHTTFLGGGFGRRFAQDFVADAVELAARTGAPVKLLYTREDDTRGAFYRPATHTRLSAALDASGTLVAFSARTVGASIAASAGMEGMLVKDGVDATAVEGLDDWPYATPNLRVEWVRHEPGVPVWFWRSVGHSQNGFVGEGFVDELAHAAKKDPFEFRRALLASQPRHRAVLELAASRAGWGTPLPAGRARGIALQASFGSYVAQVAEVSVEGGRIRVHRVVCAVDCGLVANPDTVAAQMESAIAFGLSAALYGRITLRDGAVEQGNFHDYPILPLPEMPPVEVHIVPSRDKPGGVGEPGTPPIAPAVANAVFALTGRRLRRLPLSLA